MKKEIKGRGWEVEFEEKVACAMYPIIQQITSEETIDITNLVKSFIAQQIAEAELRTARTISDCANQAGITPLELASAESWQEAVNKIIAQAEARGKQEGANIAMAVKLSSQDQLETYVAGLASNLRPIQNDVMHNEAIEKLSNIKNIGR